MQVGITTLPYYPVYSLNIKENITEITIEGLQGYMLTLNGQKVCNIDGKSSFSFKYYLSGLLNRLKKEDNDFKGDYITNLDSLILCANSLNGTPTPEKAEGRKWESLRVDRFDHILLQPCYNPHNACQFTSEPIVTVTTYVEPLQKLVATVDRPPMEDPFGVEIDYANKEAVVITLGRSLSDYIDSASHLESSNTIYDASDTKLFHCTISKGNEMKFTNFTGRVYLCLNRCSLVSRLDAKDSALFIKNKSDIEAEFRRIKAAAKSAMIIRI